MCRTIWPTAVRGGEAPLRQTSEEARASFVFAICEANDVSVEPSARLSSSGAPIVDDLQYSGSITTPNIQIGAHCAWFGGRLDPDYSDTPIANGYPAPERLIDDATVLGGRGLRDPVAAVRQR